MHCGQIVFKSSLLQICCMWDRVKFTNSKEKTVQPLFLAWIIFVMWCCSFNPFSHTTNLQQTTLKHLNKDMESLPKWRHTYWTELKTLCQKEKFLVLSNFFFCLKVFKSRLLQRRQKDPICGKWLRAAVKMHCLQICGDFFYWNVSMGQARLVIGIFFLMKLEIGPPWLFL